MSLLPASPGLWQDHGLALCWVPWWSAHPAGSAMTIAGHQIELAACGHSGEQKRHRNKPKLTPNLMVMLAREGCSVISPVLGPSGAGTRDPQSPGLLAAPPRRGPQAGHIPAQNTKPIISSFSCSSSPASTQLLAALGPNQSLAVILAPGLQGVQVEGRTLWATRK